MRGGILALGVVATGVGGLLGGCHPRQDVTARTTAHQQQAPVPAPTPPAPSKPPVSLIRAYAVPVLMYHRVCDLTEREKRSPLMRDLTVSPERFEEQIKYLVENGFTFLFVREVEEALLQGKPLPAKSVALTLDDGYKDNFEKAFPILQKYNARATIFLVTNTVQTSGHLSWEEILTMQRGEVGYGSHTVTHPDLTQLPLPRLDYELRESKRVLEERLFDRITAVAYPSGQYNRLVATRTEAAGYLTGWKKGGGPVRPKHSRDRYLLPRVRVNGGTTMKDFQRKVWSGYWAMRLSATEKTI